jgi:hypothetical protein
MTAVEIVSAMYDRQVPADVMMQARAEDAAFNDDPSVVAMQAAFDGIIWNTMRAHESIERIRDATKAGDLLTATSERKQVLPVHMRARRQYQRELAMLRAAAA